MNEQVLSVSDVLQAVKRSGLWIAVIMMACFCGSLIAYKSTAKKFKSQATLNVKPSYFQVPLINDYVSGAHEAMEIQAQKEAVVKSALDDPFLEALGRKFGLFKSGVTVRVHEMERDGLRHQIEFTPASATTIQFSALAKEAATAAQINTYVIEHVMDRFVETRRLELIKYRDTLQRQLEAMGIATPGGTAAADEATQPELVNEELATIEARIKVMEGQYTSDHPAVVALRRRAEALRKALENPAAKEVEESAAASSRSAPAIKLDPKDPKYEIYVDVMRKINYLDIVLQLERDRKGASYLEVVEKPSVPFEAVFPKLLNFVLAGLLLGGLISGGLVGYREVRRTTAPSPESGSKSLGVPLLGVLPPLKGGAPGEPRQLTGPNPAFLVRNGS